MVAGVFDDAGGDPVDLLSARVAVGHDGDGTRLIKGVEEPELVDGDPEAVSGVALQAVAQPRVQPARLEPDDLEAQTNSGGGRNRMGEMPRVQRTRANRLEGSCLDGLSRVCPQARHRQRV